MTLFPLLLAAASGAFFWTFLEYVLHRFAFHERRGANYGSREHLSHHARADYRLWALATALSWTGVIVVGFALLTPLGAWLTSSWALGWALGGGFAVGYFTYEWIHAQCHLAPPRNAYGRWVRLNHFHHHFHEPMKCHGVTSPLWDHVFGTHVPVTSVTVPRRLAPAWLLDDDQDVIDAVRDDYQLRGTRRPPDDDDRRRAFENLAPAVDVTA